MAAEISGYFDTPPLESAAPVPPITVSTMAAWFRNRQRQSSRPSQQPADKEDKLHFPIHLDNEPMTLGRITSSPENRVHYGKLFVDFANAHARPPDSPGAKYVELEPQLVKSAIGSLLRLREGLRAQKNTARFQEIHQQLASKALDHAEQTPFIAALVETRTALGNMEAATVVADVIAASGSLFNKNKFNILTVPPSLVKPPLPDLPPQVLDGPAPSVESASGL